MIEITIQANGSKIKMLRTDKRWTQEKLAEETGCSKRTIENAEASKRLKETILEDIAAALGVPSADLAVSDNGKRDWQGHPSFIETSQQTPADIRTKASFHPVDGAPPWTPKAIRLGVHFEVLRVGASEVEFTERFIQAIGPRAVQRPPSGYSEYRENILLAVLDTTPIKVTEKDLIEFGDDLIPHVTDFLIDLATRAQIVSLRNDRVVLNEPMKQEALDHFAAEFFLEEFDEFQCEVLTLFRDMTRARLALYEFKYTDLWPMVAFLALFIFDVRGVLRALWEGALKPGIIDPD